MDRVARMLSRPAAPDSAQRAASAKKSMLLASQNAPVRGNEKERKAELRVQILHTYAHNLLINKNNIYHPSWAPRTTCDLDLSAFSLRSKCWKATCALELATCCDVCPSLDTSRTQSVHEMATYSKLPSGTWRAQVRRKGRYISQTFLKRDDARRWGPEAEGRIDCGEVPICFLAGRLTPRPGTNPAPPRRHPGEVSSPLHGCASG